MIEGPIWSIGCGNMAGAMLRRWLETGLDPAQLTIIRKSGAPFAEGVTVLDSAPPDGAVPAMVLLGVKPQMIDAVAPWLAPLLAPETLLVSILAGVDLAALRQRFPTPHTIVRAMPNTPVVIGQGVVALCTDGIAEEERIAGLMAPLGLVEWVDESLFDAVTALAGSGPAFLFRFIDALAAAGADVGLDPAQAERMAIATVAGAGLLAAGSEESPGALADRVASPGGSTRKGLDVLDQPEALRPLLRDTLQAAILRNREMAAAAR
ncbi:pyrroline-5-carboxylate reductase [Sphingomonas vulcanisoli]|uniref:Pyrroline-5-carboxylate reductase n=1 Tax=Sphingomonas vulcanisoli TaxID=1658060 RepID=A0ABX0TUE4_9SPHN|nr:pyrroline-5-carboxylate reductase [Sphingomonas vulcanisoli]NIJ08339.1 pyrroline-5-carboxylate reductase [Sphingomonas vulcanisoli]